jgi:hypothetical protein
MMGTPNLRFHFEFVTKGGAGRESDHTAHGPGEEVTRAHEYGQPSEAGLACPALGVSAALEHRNQEWEHHGGHYPQPHQYGTSPAARSRIVSASADDAAAPKAANISLRDGTAERLVSLSCAINVSDSSRHTLAKALLAVLEVLAAGPQSFKWAPWRLAKNLPEMIGKTALIAEAGDQSRLSKRSGLGEQRLGVIQPEASKPIGISEYRSAESLPENLHDGLLTVAELESELGSAAEEPS